MEQRISVITLGVADVERSRAFYGALGWTPADSAPGIFFFQTGGMVFGVWSRDKLAEDSEVHDDHGGWGGITIAQNVASPEAVDTVLAEAAAAGATVLRPGSKTFWGGYNGVFADPDGHRWEIAHNPYWPLADDGSVRLP